MKTLAAPILKEWDAGAFAPELAPGETRVWVVDLDAGVNSEAEEDAVEPSAERALLNAEEQARADRFVRARDRRRFIRCRAALREILGRLLAIRGESVRFRAAGHGKPELDRAAMGPGDAGRRIALQFNVSHSAGVGLIAVGIDRPLGVDVEKVRPISEADRIVASYFTPNELAAFRDLADEAKPMAFIRGWTRKEAILKGLGVGLAGLATHHETWFGIEEVVSRFVPATPRPCVGEWHLWEATPRPGYVAALAVGALAQEQVALDHGVESERVVATSDDEFVD
jgi:4'-phosphopantetheinyl transferase